MTVQTFESVREHNNRLIRKALEGSIFVKPYDEQDEAITQIYTPAGGLIIPAGLVDVGLINKQQAQAWARDTGTADVESWGYGEPTRRDVNKDTTTLDITMQESKRVVLGLYNLADYSQVKADADGNIIVDKPDRPGVMRYTLLSLSKDGDGADAVYFARIMPNCQVTKVGNQKLGEDDAVEYPVTVTGYRDSRYGTAVREIWGGPGLPVEAMGFSATP